MSTTSEGKESSRYAAAADAVMSEGLCLPRPSHGGSVSGIRQLARVSILNTGNDSVMVVVSLSEHGSMEPGGRRPARCVGVVDGCSAAKTD